MHFHVYMVLASYSLVKRFHYMLLTALPCSQPVPVSCLSNVPIIITTHIIPYSIMTQQITRQSTLILGISEQGIVICQSIHEDSEIF